MAVSDGAVHVFETFSYEDDASPLISPADVLNLTPADANFQVQEQRPVNQSGKHRQKIDITIRCPNGKSSSLFAFEAKRLRTNGFPIGEYTGKGGMGCFLNDEYAEKMPEAAMVAYFQDKDSAHWKKQLSMKLTVSLKSVSVVSALPVEFKTEHVRNSGNAICLYHVFLDCYPDS
ncbi:MAG: hypothetical protein V3V05_01845 [Pontiella sp.]